MDAMRDAVMHDRGKDTVGTDRHRLLLLFGVLVSVGLIGPLLVGAVLGPGGMPGPGMMWGYGPQGAPPGVGAWHWGVGMAFGGLAMLAFWGALLVGVVLLVRWVGVAATQSGDRADASALDILKRRYAGGEIDQATYERMHRQLEG